jgi:hypothetical protein
MPPKQTPTHSTTCVKSTTNPTLLTSNLTIPPDKTQLRPHPSRLPRRKRNLTTLPNPMAKIHHPPTPPNRHLPPRHNLQTLLPRPPRRGLPQRRRSPVRHQTLGRLLVQTRRRRHSLLGRRAPHRYRRTASARRGDFLPRAVRERENACP